MRIKSRKVSDHLFLCVFLCFFVPKYISTRSYENPTVVIKRTYPLYNCKTHNLNTIMKKFLFPIMAILLFASCSSSEDAVTVPEPQKYSIDSSIQLDDIKLQAYIFEGNYYIEAIDQSNNKVFSIKDKAEGYIEDLGFGEKREFPINGCYLQCALIKNDYLYILVSLYADLVAHPHKFILKIKDGKVLKKEYFDTFEYDNYDVSFYPERMADWYGEYIAIYSTKRTNLYNIAILDANLSKIHGNGIPLVENWIEYIEENDYISISMNNVVYIINNAVVCMDVFKYNYSECLLWETRFTEDEIRVNKVIYSLEEDNVIVDIDATTKAGEKKNYYLTLNKDSGNLIL